VDRMRRSARAVAGFISSSNGLIVVSVVVLVTATSVLSDPQLVFPAEPAPSNWSGFLQYNDTIRASVPVGRLRTGYFSLAKDDLTPYDQNLSSSSWDAEYTFLSAQGSPSGLKVVATDQGNYSMSPLELNASSLVVDWSHPSDIRYVHAHHCNFVITGSSFPSAMVANVGPGFFYPSGPYFLNLTVTPSSPSPFSMVFHYTSAGPESAIEVHARNVSVSTGGPKPVDLTGSAVVYVTVFTDAYLGFLSMGQTIFFPEGVHAMFQMPTAEIGNASGYLVDQAGKAISPNGATLDFGRPFSLELDALYPADPTRPIETVTVSAVGARLRWIQDGSVWLPEQLASEDAAVHFSLLVITGLLTLSSGALGGLLVDRLQSRRHRR